jgi:hypothetical protein
MIIASALVKTLEDLRPHYPRVDKAMRRDMKRAKKALLAE